MAYQTTYGPDGRLRVAILGCTGSIGTQALDVCRQHADRLQVTALSVNSSTSELVAAAREFSVPAVAVADASHGADAVLQELPEGTELGVGAQAVCELACRDDVDCVLVAIVGAAGLEASHAALTSNKRLALANKETLVSAGPLFLATAQRAGTRILPVDSEHNAIFQVFETDNARDVSEVIITASGGPFLRTPKEELAAVTRDMALKHPKWSMGPKITIEPWDYRFYAEKVSKAKYDLDESEVKPYLQLDNIVQAAFYAAGRLYDLKFTENTGTVPVWHPDVRTFEVTNSKTGKVIGLWYLDTYAREGKRSGAWATGYRDSSGLLGSRPKLVSNNNNFIKFFC